MGSLEITELIRRRLAHEISSLGVSTFGVSGVSSLSSPFGGAEQAKGFWFNVNAELIIYGATEPNAKVTLGGHEIKLRPDGSFSYRFALPDGKYDLPAVAVSADGTDGRAANLKFSRETEYLGDVGAHPQDPSLKPPLPENLVISMDAQLPGSLDARPLCRRHFHGHERGGTRIVLGRTQIPPDAGEHSSFRAVGHFTSGRRRHFDQGQSHRELDFRQAGMNF